MYKPLLLLRAMWLSILPTPFVVYVCWSRISLATSSTKSESAFLRFCRLVKRRLQPFSSFAKCLVSLLESESSNISTILFIVPRQIPDVLVLPGIVRVPFSWGTTKRIRHGNVIFFFVTPHLYWPRQGLQPMVEFGLSKYKYLSLDDLDIDGRAST